MLLLAGFDLRYGGVCGSWLHDGFAAREWNGLYRRGLWENTGTEWVVTWKHQIVLRRGCHNTTKAFRGINRYSYCGQHRPIHVHWALSLPSLRRPISFEMERERSSTFHRLAKILFQRRHHELLRVLPEIDSGWSRQWRIEIEGKRFESYQRLWIEHELHRHVLETKVLVFQGLLWGAAKYELHQFYEIRAWRL